MSETLEVGELVYYVRRSAKRRTLGITIDRDGVLILDTPADCAWATIKAMGREKSLWVYSKLAERDMLFRPKRAREYVTGETFYYLGRAYRLRLVKPKADDQQPLVLHGGRFHLRTDEVAQAGEHFRDWYTAYLRRGSSGAWSGLHAAWAPGPSGSWCGIWAIAGAPARPAAS